MSKNMFDNVVYQFHKRSNSKASSNNSLFKTKFDKILNFYF